MRAVLEPGIIYPGDTWIVAQEFRDLARILDMTLDAQRHGLDALQQQKGVQCGQNGAGRALIHAARACDVSGGPEMIGINEPVIRRIGLTEHRIARRICLPRKLAGIDKGAAERGAMAAHEFRQRMHDNVGAVLDRPQQDRRCHRIVDNERHAMRMRDLRQLLDVANISRGVADRLAKHRARVLVDQPPDRVRVIAFGEAASDALLRQDVREQRVRCAVELRHGDDVAAAIGERHDRIIQRRLPCADRERRMGALEFRDAPLQHGDRRDC